MPYDISNPPEKIKDMPAHAIEIWVSAFNAALKQYQDEGKANATAYSAVKTKYKQDEKGNWVVKEGGQGSGNFGHEGRPGEIGGSGGGGGGISGQEWAGSLSEEQTQHIIDWQDNTSCARIRNAQIKGENIPEAKALDDVLNTDGNYEGVTYRGLNELSDDSYSEIMNSETITMKAHSSASKDRIVAMDFATSHGGGKSVLFRVQGKTGVDVSVIKGSGFEDQSEVILRRGTKYAVGGHSQLGDITVVQLKEL